MFQASLLDDTDESGPRPLSSARRTRLSHGAWVDVLPAWIPNADALFERLLTSVPWREESRRMYDRVVDVPRLLSFYDEDDVLPDPVLDEAKAALDGHYADELGEPFRTAGLCLYRDGHDSVAWHGDRIGRGDKEDTMVAILSLGTPRSLLLRPRGGDQNGGDDQTRDDDRTRGDNQTHGGSQTRGDDQTRGDGQAHGDGRARGGSQAHSDGQTRGGGQARSDGQTHGDGQARGGGRTRGAGRTVRYELGHGDLIVMGGSCQRTWEHAIPKSARVTGARISVQFRPRGVR